MKISKRVILCFVALLFLYMTISTGGTYKYLKEYGYSVDILPQTLAVYFGLSNGFTVGEIPDSDISIFIGNHNYIYEKIFNEHGYYEVDRLGLMGYYNKTNNINDALSFSVFSHNEWCHWFRVYTISNGYKIEDFI